MSQENKQQAPKAQGIRQAWTDIPQKIRHLIEDFIGAEVTHTETQSGGFSPGVAARLYTADKQCYFLKAIGTDLNPTSVNFHRKEVIINAKLPENSFAPKMLWSHDDADDTEWVALLFDNIDGSNPPTPWQNNDLERVMMALNDLSTTLTPSPIASGLIPTAKEYFASRIRGWNTIRDNSATYGDLLDDWSKRHLDALCELEQQAPDAVTGNTLVHFDIRADNIVMNDDGVWFVDFPHACVGAAWLDTVLFAPSVTMQDGLPPDELIQLHPACQEADPNELTAAVVSVAGMLSLRALQPPPPGLPTLREFQAAMAEVTRQWVAQRTGWA